MQFEAKGTVINKGKFHKGEGQFIQLMSPRPDGEGNDVLMVWAKPETFAKAEINKPISVKVRAFIKSAQEV